MIKFKDEATISESGKLDVWNARIVKGKFVDETS